MGEQPACWQQRADGVPACTWVTGRPGARRDPVYRALVSQREKDSEANGEAPKRGDTGWEGTRCAGTGALARSSGAKGGPGRRGRGEGERRAAPGTDGHRNATAARRRGGDGGARLCPRRGPAPAAAARGRSHRPSAGMGGEGGGLEPRDPGAGPGGSGAAVTFQRLEDRLRHLGAGAAATRQPERAWREEGGEAEGGAAPPAARGRPPHAA